MQCGFRDKILNAFIPPKSIHVLFFDLFHVKNIDSSNLLVDTRKIIILPFLSNYLIICIAKRISFNFT